LIFRIKHYKGGVTSNLELITAQNAVLADESQQFNILGRRMASAVQIGRLLFLFWAAQGKEAYPFPVRRNA
jgi:outer membrane protein TolC